MDFFPPWKARVRKDPLGPAGFARACIERPRWNLAAFGVQHDSYAGEHLRENGTSVGTAGEHNAPEVPREVGSIAVAAGPTYATTNFRYATGATYVSTGNLTLNLSSLPYSDIYSMALQLQSCSETGITKPCITQYVITSVSTITLYSQSLSSALGAGNTWAAENAHLCIAVHGPPMGGAGPASPTAKQRGDWFTEEATDYNLAVRTDAAARAAFLAEHTAAGVHTNREVARTWAHVGVRAGGGVYDLLDTSARLPLSVTRPGAGICRLTTGSAWVLDAQPFVMPDFQRLNGGSESDVYCVVTPRSLITTTTIDVYIYKYTAGAPGSWARADTDFYVAVHAGT